MHGLHRTPQHRNGDFSWLLRTRFCRVVAQIVIVALLLVDVPVPTDYLAVAEATGSSSFQPRILALAPSCVARGANFKIILANFDRTRPLTVKVGGVVATIVSTTTLSSTTKKLVVTMPQTATPGRTTVIVSNNKPQSASKIMRVRQAEICGNGVDDDCNGKVDDRDASGKRCPLINHPPVANAGPDQSVLLGQSVQLDGSASSDVDEQALTFAWSLTSAPSGSTATVSDPSAAKPTITLDQPGQYILQLVVNDGTIDSDPDTVILSTQNSQPVANAGPDQTVALNARVVLTGSQSSDADGNPLTYRWTLVTVPSGSTAVLDTPSSLSPSFTADKLGSYTAQLIVNDGTVDSDPDTVDITAAAANQPPTITSTPGTAATVGQLYSYDVEATDLDNDSLIFSLSTSPSNMAINATTGEITWTPRSEQTGDQNVTVHVSDAREGVDTQSFTIAVAAPPQNRAPIANDNSYEAIAGTTLNVPAPGVLGNDTDPDNNPLTAQLVTSPTSGTLNFNANGAFAYTPGASPSETCPNLLINGSFEEGPSPGIFLALANGSTAITGWTVVRDNIHYVGTYWPSSHRNRSLDLDGGIAGAIEQSFATTSGQQYTVAFDMVGNPAGPPTIKPMRVSAAGQSQEFTFDTTGRSLTNMGWTPHTWTFTANATTTTLRLESLTAEKRLTQGWGPAVDNIRVGEGCVPPAWEVNAALKWKKDTFNILPASNQILSNPAIIDVNNDGVPDIIFSTFVAPTWWQDGVLRAISGSDGTEIWSVTDPNHEVSGLSSIAVGDIDLDGRPEILAAKEFPSSTVSTQSSVLLAFEHDGTFKWESPPIPDGIGFGGPSIADLEGDGIPEVVVGATVLNNDGTIRWSGTQGHGNNSYGPLSLIADLDLDGHPEIVAGRSAYRANGSIYWNNTSLSDGFPAVGNFDEDPFPEIVLVSRGSVYLLEHTGTIKWGPIVIPGSGNGGPPTVADVDGDGQPEIGVAGANRYVVLETNGTIKWQVVIQDVISSVTGSSVFDFEGDGTAEVIYGDELFLRVFRGSDGTELFKRSRARPTRHFPASFIGALCTPYDEHRPCRRMPRVTGFPV